METKDIEVNNMFSMDLTVKKNAEYIPVEEYWTFYVENGVIASSRRVTSVERSDGKWEQVTKDKIDTKDIPPEVIEVVDEQLGWD